jgi:thiol:disulfide interchange protein DsbD
MQLRGNSWRVDERSWALFFCCFLLFALVLAPEAAAGPQPAPHSSVELISENSSVSAGTEFSLGLLFRLEPHWHIYWVNPGDSGEPPRVSWQMPQGFTADAIQWPTPKRLATGTLLDFGYEQQVLLPVRVRVPGAVAQQVPIHAAVKWLVCGNICIPAKAEVDLTLPVGTKPVVNPQTAPLFQQARAALPKPVPKGWKLRVEDSKDEVRLSVNSAGKLRSAVFFPLDANVIEDSSPQRVQKSASGFTLSLKKSDQLTGPLTLLRGVLADSETHSYAVSVPAVRGSSK